MTMCNHSLEHRFHRSHPDFERLLRGYPEAKLRQAHECFARAWRVPGPTRPQHDRWSAETAIAIQDELSCRFRDES